MKDDASRTATRLLARSRGGSREALDNLMPLVYNELRRLAGGYFRGERPGHTLQPTALVNEVYLRLIDQTQVGLDERTHFFAIASHMMRRVLVDHARRRRAKKRGGTVTRFVLDEARDRQERADVLVEELADALQSLEALDPRQSRIVELRFFGGLSVEEVAEETGISTGTVKREWRIARAWLYHELNKQDASRGS